MSEITSRTTKSRQRLERALTTSRPSTAPQAAARKAKAKGRVMLGVDDDNKEEVDYEELLSAKDVQIMELQQQLDAEARRNNMLESELSLALAAAHRAEEAHSNELAKVESDVTRVMAERRTLLEKLQQIEVVEDAVRELYVQMKDRIGEDDHPTLEQLHFEKAQLKEENVLVVLGHLHATLKSLWAFKVEAETDMRAKRFDRSQRGQTQVLALKEEIRRLQGELERATKLAETYKEETAQEGAAKVKLYEESMFMKTNMDDKNKELLKELLGLQRENSDLRSALHQALEEGRRRDSLVLRNKQLESARHFDRVAQDRELRIMQNEHLKQLEELQKHLNKISDVLYENAFLKEQLEEANREMLSLKRSFKTYHNEELEMQVMRLSSVLAHKTMSEQKLRNELHKVTTKQARNGKQELPKSTKLYMRASKSAEEAALLAEEEKAAKDPLYDLLSNVDKMHREARSSIKSFKQGLNGPRFNGKFLSFAEDTLQQAGSMPVKSAATSKANTCPASAQAQFSG